ncbi:flagellar protein G [Methanothermococcus okinawensis]|nr:flagellar protein G [Methanothermococcus okinawensis]
MASNVFSEIIIFVSVLIIAASVSGILATSTHKLSIGINNKGDILSSKLSQDFEIINDPADIPRNQSTGIISVYIKNTGKTPITFNKGVLTVLIDGDIKSINSTTVVDDSSSNELLNPSKVGKIDVNYNTTGYHRIKVVSENGVARTLKVDIQ